MNTNIPKILWTSDTNWQIGVKTWRFLAPLDRFIRFSRHPSKDIRRTAVVVGLQA